MALAGWSAFVHPYGSTCDYSLMGLVWSVFVLYLVVSSHFQATCLPLALHLFTRMDLLVTTASWFGLVYSGL